MIKDKRLIPFFVADRPISLSIIKGVTLPKAAKVGIMTHAFTSKRFKLHYMNYPFGTDVIYPNGQPKNSRIEKQTIRMVDSGIFEKCEISKTHGYLFQTYEDMAADYGVMMDVLKDKDATLNNAKMAMKIYREKLWNFKLVGVAQGNSLKEFIDCYEALIDLGYTHIAVGGLLKKTENTVRYLKVGSEELMIDVLTAIREKYNPTWLFVLGSFHPRRMELFDQLQVWGSDYKGWIFNYKKKEELINAIKNDRLKKLTKIEVGDLNIGQVKKMTEQQIRFYLVRQFIEKKILHPIYGQE